MSDHETTHGPETGPSDIKGSPFTAIDADLGRHPKVVNWAARSKTADATFSKKIWEYTIGDLHGNAALGLWHALRVGAVKFKQPAEGTPLENPYEEFWKLYETERKTPKPLLVGGSIKKLTTEERDKFVKRYQDYRRILEKLEVNNIDVFLRFLGDLLFDRGANDLFTLLFIKRLKDLGAKFTIIASNHDMYFLSVYEQAKRDTQQGLGTLKENLLKYYKLSSARGFESGRRLIAALEEEMITEKEFQDLVENYKSCLRAVDYSFVPAAEPDTGEGQTYIYIHGAVGAEALRFYANYFRIDYRDGTKERLKMMDEINAKFQQALRNGDDMIALYDAQYEEARKSRFDGEKSLNAGEHARTLETEAGKTFISEHFTQTAKNNPLIYACEARGEDPAAPKQEDTAPRSNLHMLEIPKDVVMIHGHHPQAKETAARGLYSLDQEFGKDNLFRGYAIEGTVLVHEQEVTANLRHEQTLATNKAKTYDTQKKLAYVIGSVGFIGSIGTGIAFTIRASVPKKDLADFFLKVPDLSQLSAGSAAGVGIGLVILFIASVVILGKGHQLGVKQKQEEKKETGINQEHSR